ncbi:ABC transporter permease [Falsiroseomonas sp. CW058]|uniref:ABC transporter permease n=1 Tax=Falsiroseomonas sp. CW058 TaxID=3388664 RepID=UPI003D31F5E7
MATRPPIPPGRALAGTGRAPSAFRGFLALAARETRRFLKVWAQTLGAPVITTLLFLAVFVLALGETKKEVGGIPYLQFLGAGLVMMALAQNAFANSSSSLVIMKVQGNIVDLLMAPLPPAALLGGMVAGGALRGLAVAVAVLAAMWPLVGFPVPAPFTALAFAVLGSTLMATLGVLAGLWAQKFDQLATVTNFVVTPLAFLSGTFYSVERLPEPILAVAHADPLFWMIDGFRAGLAGHAEGSTALGLAGLAAANLLLWWAALVAVRRGWRLRA